MTRIHRAIPSRPAASTLAPTAWRVRFISGTDSPAGRVIRRFTEPAPAVAVAEVVQLSDLPGSPVWPEPADELLVVHIPNPSASAEIGPAWIVPGENPDATLPVELPLKDGRLLWRPGRVIIEGKVRSIDEVLAGIAEFAFYEGQLRKLESAIVPIEAGAAADVTHVYVVGAEGKANRERFRQTIERLATLRLTAARVEPRLYLRPRALPLAAQNIVRRLCSRADTEARLESMSDRLEACEDLYEGAVDRITDHRWYRKGMWVEIAIVILLFMEVLQLAATMIFHGVPGR
ncbi:MAG TPA: hypothetical protein VFE47_06160 [Tepidisphaeraceae bacterium]|jgi:hypothetical protein|nr:hypothetical protein [Tepidisphaeraceae bacterium]